MFFHKQTQTNGTKLNDLNKEETCRETKNSHFNGLFFLAILIGVASPTVCAENKEQTTIPLQPFQK